MSKITSIGLGILAAVGGFIDFGGIVTSTQAGAQFRFALIWTLVVGVVGFAVFAEMSARIAIATSRTMYDVIRDRLGASLALVPLVSTTISQILTVFVELAGMALVLEYISGISYLAFVPLMGLLLLVIVWLAGFDLMDNGTAMLGLSLLVVLAVVIKGLHDWGGASLALVHPSMSTTHPLALYLFSVVSLLGAYMTPYQFVFYTSGALEEEWSGADFSTNRIVSLVGTAFGGVVGLGIMITAAVYLFPIHNQASTFSALPLPVKDGVSEIGVALFLLGTFAVCAGAGLEAVLSGSYAVMQYFGLDWGKKGRPRMAPVFHLGMAILLATAVIIAETRIDPIQMTTLGMAAAAVALPFNFLPLLIVANDRRFMGGQANTFGTNAIAILLVALLCVVALAAIPLAFLSGSI